MVVPERRAVVPAVLSGDSTRVCVVPSECAEDSAHYCAEVMVKCMVARECSSRRIGRRLPVSLHHFAAAGLRAAHGRNRPLCRAVNRDVRDSQSGLARTRRELTLPG